MSFHAKDNLFFKRLSQGSVKVTCPEGEEVTLTPETWASVVASMSDEGETYETWKAALKSHQGYA